MFEQFRDSWEIWRLKVDKALGGEVGPIKASDVVFNNAGTDLLSTDAEDAIKEVNDKTSTIPTKTSQLTNDNGFITSASLPTVNNGTLKIQKNGTDVETFTANQSGDTTANITVPTATSELTNDSGFITSASLPTVNNGTLKIQKNGTNVETFTANQSTNATANIIVPTKTSELTNDSGYTTNTGTVTQVKVGSTAYNPSSGVVSLPSYPAVPTKTSQLTNDSGFLNPADMISATYNFTGGSVTARKFGRIVVYDVTWSNSSKASGTTLTTVGNDYKPVANCCARNCYDNQSGTIQVNTNGTVVYTSASGTAATFGIATVTGVSAN